MCESAKLTRRAAIAGPLAVACMPSATTSSIAPDQIFSAIAAHRRVYAELLKLFDAQRAADEAVQQADALARPALEARLSALCRAEGPLGRLEMRASNRMAATVPTTLDGAVAVLRYLRELFERDDYSPFEDDEYRRLLNSTECALVRYCGS